MSEQIRAKELLHSSKVIAVVGISANPSRPSHEVAAYLQRHAYILLLVNPLEAGHTILGLPCYASLTEAAEKTGKRIDIVDCFRRSEAIPEVVAEAIALHAGAVWMQQGVINHDAAKIARDAGLAVIMNRCIKIDHLQLS
ncbi:CoA-binding protein [Undibacterium sp. Jales W-56]|uniref:CoA-binding protein n=1 Tax=Undibacterium sp. Jales W-56 TaxID=2897325 RepID=UPI0021D0A77B|nr:CoA-binding protein [Undibacterium sp. Jales W-56]MCU6434362.1 CoA-binding protein [Undibacterium sp. Jales W-56]